MKILLKRLYILYRVSQKKTERWIFSTLRAESDKYFYIIRYIIFRRREWYLDH